MAHRLTHEQVRRIRSFHQGLTGESAAADAAQAVRQLCGLQAQELPSAHLALRARTTGLTAADVRRAREVERAVVLTWTLRGTLHLIAAEDVRRQLALFGTLSIHRAERRFRQLGLDADTRRTAAERIRNLLGTRGPLTRAELAAALAQDGIPVEGQAIHYLVYYAALTGIICFGPERSGSLTYVVLDNWLNSDDRDTITGADMLAELARRYLSAHAPATLADFASWSSLSAGQAKAGFEAIAGELIEVETPSATAWMLKQQRERLDTLSAARSVRLLPRYDSYLLGYQSRAFMVQADYAQRIHPGGGLIRASVIVDGEARGNWRMEHKRAATTITVEPFESFGADIVPGLEAEAQDIGRFLNVNARLSLA